LLNIDIAPTPAGYQMCSGNELPETHVEYLPGDAACQSDVELEVGHFLQLGVYCEESTGGNYTTYSDYLFECGHDNSFDFMDGQFTCGSVLAFEPGSDGVSTVPAVEIATDFRWSEVALSTVDSCFTFDPATAEPSAATETDAPGPCINLGLGIGLGSGCSDNDESDDTESPTETPLANAPAPTLAPSVGIVVTTPAPSVAASETPEPATEAPVSTPAPTLAADDESLTIAPGTTFSQDYVARFKHVLDDGCEGPAPNLVVACPTGQITILGTSDSIACLPAEPFETEGEIVLCATTCNGAECDNVYVDREVLYLFGVYVLNEESYGEIEFRCEAAAPEDVTANFFISGSETGLCSGSGTGDGQNFMLTQLNVLCPDEDNAGELVYTNDDSYTECGSGILSFNINGDYSCYTGRVCGTDACQVSFDDLLLSTDPHRYRNCILTDNGSLVPPVPVPEIDPKDAGEYTSQFQVGSGFFYDEENCSAQKTGQRVSCDNGSIELISSGDKTCEVISENTIECMPNDLSAVNEFVVDLVYVSCFSLCYLFSSLLVAFSLTTIPDIRHDRNVQAVTRYPQPVLRCTPRIVPVILLLLSEQDVTSTWPPFAETQATSPLSALIISLSVLKTMNLISLLMTSSLPVSQLSRFQPTPTTWPIRCRRSTFQLITGGPCSPRIVVTHSSLVQLLPQRWQELQQSKQRLVARHLVALAAAATTTKARTTVPR
jgi:hypothetical protein